jgi:hypothetical protein
MRGGTSLFKVAGPWQNFSLKWLEQEVDASGSYRPNNRTHLNDSTEYNALSYIWGDPKLPELVITVDGYNKGVTENCKLAMEELRREAMTQLKTQFIWIDAICINQKDRRERSQQILVMRDIYENAKKLVIWLGVEADRSHDAIEIMKEFPGGFDEDTIAEWLKWFQMQPNSVDLWSSIICFFSRSWFTRVWVIQEFVVSMESHDMRIENQEDFIEFYCGTKPSDSECASKYPSCGEGDRQVEAKE